MPVDEALKLIESVLSQVRCTLDEHKRLQLALKTVCEELAKQ